MYNVLFALPVSLPNATSPTYTVTLATSRYIVLSAIHKFDSLNNKAKRAICKRCRRSRNKVNSYYNGSPLTSIMLLLMKSGDVSKRGPAHQNTRVVILERVSLNCRGRAISCDSCASGHTTNVPAFSQMMSTINSAAAIANIHFCASSVHFTPCRLLMTAIALLSSRKAMTPPTSQ